MYAVCVALCTVLTFFFFFVYRILVDSVFIFGCLCRSMNGYMERWSEYGER